MSAAALREARAWRKAFWQPRDVRKLSERAQEYALPQSERHGHFEPTDAPWLVDPLDSQDDPYVTSTVFVAAVGSAKSLIGELVICDDVRQGSGIIYYVHQTDDAARDAMEDRVTPMLEANGDIGTELPQGRTDKRTRKVRFKQVTLYATGAKLSAAQSKRTRRLIKEETHQWDKGLQSAFNDRMVAVSGAKSLTLSSGGVSGDETHAEFRAGTMEEWHVVCPYCRTPQVMKNRRLRFDINERTISREGEHNWGEIRRAVYYRCVNEDCPGPGLPGEAGKWRDTEDLRRQLTDSGYYVQTNPNAAGDIRSFRINALAVHWNPWYKLLAEWLAANVARKFGQFELLREYIQKKLAEFWDENKQYEDPGDIPKGRIGNYEQGPHWKDGKPDWEDGWQELTRFQAIDKNEGWFTIEVRAFRADGDNRLVMERGGTRPGSPQAKNSRPVLTFEECEEIREQCGVEPMRTFLDIADDTRLCQQKCVEYGWQGLWGDDRRNWQHTTQSIFHPKVIAYTEKRPYKHIPDTPIKLPFSPEVLGKANSGLGGKEQVCTYYHWSNPIFKDFWHYCHDTGGGPGFTQARVVSETYKLQTSAEFKKDIGGRKQWTHLKRDNHFTDCSQMNFVGASMDDRIDLGDSIIKALQDAQALA